VLVARSASELFIKAQHLQPALILLDSDFAVASTLQQLQAHLATQTIPIACLGVTAPAETTTPVFQLAVPIQPTQLKQIWQELALTSEPPPLPQPSRLPTPNLALLGAGSRLRNPLHKPNPQSNLTVLRLGNHSRIHLQQCRVLEADDLEQAELLSLIWQPDVLLWDWNSPDSLAALLSLSQHQRLYSLPLVTLDVATTRAAAQLPRLQIFPCLVAETLPTASLEQASQTLSQVLQVAASYRETGA
jgi:CheY-like chemotaxis protein